VKTSLCNEGILALNIGIVDPGFSGPLQCTLVNFGKRRYRLKAGTIFGRITFHENEPISDLKGDSRTLQQVTEIAQDDVRKYLASDFLNFSKTVRKAAKQATSQYRDMLLWWLPLFATLLAGLTLFLNFQNLSRLERYINVEDRATELKHQEDLESRIRSLESDRAALQRQLEQLGTNSTLTGGDSQTESNVKSPRK
jgi:hypothetical protein